MIVESKTIAGVSPTSRQRELLCQPCENETSLVFITTRETGSSPEKKKNQKLNKINYEKKKRNETKREVARRTRDFYGISKLKSPSPSPRTGEPGEGVGNSVEGGGEQQDMTEARDLADGVLIIFLGQASE